MNISETGLYCVIVSLLWGATNPLIKNTTKSISKVEASNCVTTFINEVIYLIANWKYVLFFVINQCGSVLYFIALQNIDLSLIVPIVNALTFIVTGFVGILIGENSPNYRSILGLVFIIVGIFFCVFDKF